MENSYKSEAPIKMTPIHFHLRSRETNKISDPLINVQSTQCDKIECWSVENHLAEALSELELDKYEFNVSEKQIERLNKIKHHILCAWDKME